MDRLLMHKALTVYADGGVILKNPSPHGGTWGYRIVDPDGSVLREDCGAYGAHWTGLGAVGNNDSETLALVTALEAAQAYVLSDQPVVVCSDSLNALRRVFDTAPLDGIGYDALRRRVVSARRWVTGRWSGLPVSRVFALGQFHGDARAHTLVVLLEGHPTKEHLARGYGRKGYPVSAHQDWCDRAAKQAGKAFLAHGQVSQTISMPT